MPRPSHTELLVRQPLRVLSRSLPAAEQGHGPSVHQARVATRRLGEVLPLVASKARHRKLARSLRRIRRALGPMRELDVALQILDEIETSNDVPRPAIGGLKQVIREERRRLHKEMRRRLERCDLRRLQKRVLAASRHPERRQHRKRDKSARLQAARARVGRRALTLRAAVESAAGMYLPDRLHGVRVAVKKVRYAMELAGTISGSPAVARLATLRRAQELLGRMNDLEVLIARTRGIQGSASAPDLKLSADMDVLVRRLEMECRELHGHFIASRKALLLICDRTIAQQARSDVRAA